MTRYFNTRTGDTVEIDGRSARLDALDVWKVVNDGDETPQVVSDGVLSRPTLTATGVHDPSADVPQTNEELRKQEPESAGDGPGQELTSTEDGQTSQLKVPSRKAGLAAWQEYARLVEDDPERQSDIEGLSKDELVARYGGGS
ncbi:hypothetical protein [Streptomyces sp. NPDC060194]|uniref:hypothetical protein n=1 Tax=Streptomyces sp. NPDC060194 TaxID=3347069 RepID=UPI003664D68F